DPNEGRRRWRLLDDQVPAAGRASALEDDLVSVVAILELRLDDAVAAVRAQLAVRCAPPIGAGVFVLPVVALLADGDDAVAAGGRALAGGGVESAQRQAEGGAGGLAFGLEHRDLVHLAVGQAEVGARAGAEGDGALHRGVDGAQVDRELAVDEHPDVVVAREIQRVALGRVVLEPVADLAGEAEVVLGRPGFRRVAPAGVVGRRDGRRDPLAGRRERVAVDREEGRRPIQQPALVDGGVAAVLRGAADLRVAHGIVLVAVSAGGGRGRARDGQPGGGVGLFGANVAAVVRVHGDRPLLAVRAVPIHVGALAVAPERQLAGGAVVHAGRVVVPLGERRRAGDVGGGVAGGRAAENRFAVRVQHRLHEPRDDFREPGRARLEIRRHLGAEVAVKRRDHHLVPQHRLHVGEPRLDLAIGRAAVAAHVVSVVAGLVDNQAVPAPGRAAAAGLARRLV